MVRPAHSQAALRNVRVLELSDALGQYAGKLLADLGADVLKIEPVGGSPVRHIGPFKDDVPDINRSLTFWQYNSSKRGLTLNLEAEDGRDLFRRLARTADVIIESFAPGHLDSLGLGYDAMRAENPKLIVCSITHFGQDGPWRDFVAGDAVHMALGGTMASSGYDDVPGAPPIAPTGGNAYHTVGHIATSSILVALFHAKRTGQGQYIDMAAHDSAAVTTELAFFDWVYGGGVVKRATGRHAAIQPWTKTTFSTRDGGQLNIGMNPMTQKNWEGLIAWMAKTGEAEDLTEPQYAEMKAFRANEAHVMEVLGRFIANHDRDELYHGGQGLRFAWSPIVSVDEVPNHPHWQARNMVVDVEYPELGRSYQHIAGPFKLSRSFGEIRGRAPLLGEHNEDVFAGEFGLEKGSLVALSEAGVI